MIVTEFLNNLIGCDSNFGISSGSNIDTCI